MYRRLLFSLCIASVAVASFPSLASTVGTDYVVLEKPIANAEGTLIKVFSYDCPFCFKYDVGVDPRVMPRVEKEIGLKFKPMHLETKGQYGRSASLFLAMCMLRDEEKGISIEEKDSLFKKAKDAIYNAYHKKQERWTAGEGAFLKTLTDATGLSQADYEKAKTDASVVALADSWKVTYPVAKIQGIPAYVVNGKYLIMTKSIRNFDGMVALIKELSLKK